MHGSTRQRSALTLCPGKRSGRRPCLRQKSFRIAVILRADQKRELFIITDVAYRHPGTTSGARARNRDACAARWGCTGEGRSEGRGRVHRTIRGSSVLLFTWQKKKRIGLDRRARLGSSNRESVTNCSYFVTLWLNGRAFDSRSKGCGFESHRGHHVDFFCRFYHFLLLFVPRILKPM